MRNPLEALQGSDPLMPHGMCYLWRPGLLWLHVLSDSLVAASYFAIPPVLIYLVVRARRELKDGEVMGLEGLPFDRVFVAFGLFIVACGTTHLLGVVTVWKPVYWISGSAKALTAIASVATAVALPPFVPRVIALVRSARRSEHHRRELEHAHEELRELNRKLREMDRARTRFFANVSQELRTPLTLILGPTELMLEDGSLPPAHVRRARTVHASALQLVAMVDDLLEVTDIESGSAVVKPTTFDLVRLVRSTAERFELLAESRGVDFEVAAAGSADVHGDVSKTERALAHLLSDSFRFTPPGGLIRLRVEEAGGRVRVVLEDSGPPVPDGAAEAVFDRFSEVERVPTRRFGGTALALSIAGDFTEMQGGKVSATTSSFGGAAFRLELPRATPEHADAVAEPTRPTDETACAPPPLAHGAAPEADPRPYRWPEDDTRPRLLVVEDHPGLRAYIADVLSEEFSCASAPDGGSALALARETPPDVIVTALALPGMGGEELLQRVRRTPSLRDVPVLVLTGRGDPWLPARLLRGGAQDHLVHPVRADELLARVRNLVSAASARAVLKSALGGAHGDLPALSLELVARKRELEGAIRDKEMLLQELHHRVKGNLQTVASLMNLQLRTLEDPVAREALADSRSRIRAIALLHERLYNDGQPTEVDVGGYLRGLASELGAAFAPRGGAARVQVRAASLQLDVERAVACGLLAHELVLNALEHGACEGERPEVTLSLTRWDDSGVLVVEDRGPGLPERRREGGLGLRLVDALTRQLGGALRFDNRAGLRCEIRFPLKRRRKGVTIS